MGLRHVGLAGSTLVLVLALVAGTPPAVAAAPTGTTASVTVTATVPSVFSVAAEPGDGGGTVLTVRTNATGLVLISGGLGEGRITATVPKGESVHRVEGDWSIVGR